MSCTDGCNCEPGGYLGADRCEYRLLADEVIELFNPHDGETAEVDLCMQALREAHAALIEMPCSCTSAALDLNVMGPPCGRCRALGRRGDVLEVR